MKKKQTKPETETTAQEATATPQPSPTQQKGFDVVFSIPSGNNCKGCPLMHGDGGCLIFEFSYYQMDYDNTSGDQKKIKQTQSHYGCTPEGFKWINDNNKIIERD